MRPNAFPALLVAPALFLSGSGRGAHAADLVATVPYVADLARELSCEGEPLPLETLVKPERDPHTFALLPADRARVARAKLVVFVSRSFETWLGRKGNDAEKGSASDAALASRWLELADGLPLRRLVAADGHVHGEVDPHIWQSPALTQQAAARFADRLALLFPGRAVAVRRCLVAFTAKIKEVERELRAKVATLPAEQRVIATDHDAFGGFAGAFGFEVLAVQGLSTEASPTPARLKSVVDAVRKRGVRAVFLEASVAPRLMQSVARETGVRIGGTLYADGLGGPGSGAESTLALWRKNMDTIVSALR